MKKKTKPTWIPDSLPRDPKKRRQMFHQLPLEMEADYWERQDNDYDRLNTWLAEEGALAVLRSDKRGAGGILFAEAAGSHLPTGNAVPPSVKLVPEHFNRLLRLFFFQAEDGIRVA